MKKNYEYLFCILLFISFLLLNLLFYSINMDEIWCYGFSHNIANGLIPYKDFNMVITPFYSMLMALFLKINDSFLLFHIINSMIVVLFIFIVYKLIKEKVYFILPLLLFPLNITSPTYNFFILFLFVLLIYLEKNNKNNYLIGLIISLIFLTKQSIGIFLIPVSLYYIKEKEKLFKRFIGFIVPCLLFIVYLLFTNSYKEFIDLCILGLFDFGKNNTNINILMLIPILLLILLLLLIKNNKKNIYYYYLLGFISVSMPLFDLYHIHVYVVAFVIVLLMNDIKIFKPKLIGTMLFIGLLGIDISRSGFDIKYYPNNLNTFKYKYIDKKGIDNTNEVIKYMKKYNNKVIFIGPVGYYYKLIVNENLTSLDLINNGNFGYKGSKKILDRIKKLDNDYVFFINKNDDIDVIGTQTDKELVKYILKNYKKIDETSHYNIYMKPVLE